MKSQKFRYNYKKHYSAIKNRKYDYSKLYKVFHKHGTLLESGYYDLIQLMSILFVTPNSSGVYEATIPYLVLLMFFACKQPLNPVLYQMHFCSLVVCMHQDKQVV